MFRVIVFHLNYRWLLEHCGMTEERGVDLFGETQMTHNAACISAATYPEIGAAYFIFLFFHVPFLVVFIAG